MANRKSRKRRDRQAGGRPTQAPSAEADEALAQDEAPAGYSRSRARNDQVRAALKPLRPGERPTAVTVGAVAAGLLALANLVALVLGYSPGEDTVSPGSEATGTVVAALICAVVAYGMWKARYWGVLGMQTLLALTLVFASLGLVTASTLWAALLLVIIIALAGTLFWFLVKAMARIQMPSRPGASSGGR